MKLAGQQHTVKLIHVVIESSSSPRLWNKSMGTCGNVMVDSIESNDIWGIGLGECIRSNVPRRRLNTFLQGLLYISSKYPEGTQPILPVLVHLIEISTAYGIDGSNIMGCTAAKVRPNRRKGVPIPCYHCRNSGFKLMWHNLFLESHENLGLIFLLVSTTALH